METIYATTLIYNKLNFNNNMKQIFYAALVVAFVSLTACVNTSRDNVQDGITIAHSLDTIVVKKNPQRVVVFDIGTLDTFKKLGLKVVGAPKKSMPGYLADYLNDDSIVDVGSVKEANYEKISLLNPDLIIISGRLQEAYPELSKIAPTLFVSLNYKDYIPTFKEDARNIGKIFDKEAEVEADLVALDKKIESVKAKVSASDKKSLIVLFNNGRMSSYGKGSRFGFIHDVLGAKTAIDEIEATTHGQVISSEMIETTDPDILFVVDRGAVVNGKFTSKEEIENELIRQTKAFKDGKIVYLTPEIWYLSGGGLISADMMAEEIDKVF